MKQGEITIDGRSVKTDPLGCKQISAYIPDNPDLYEFLSGIKYLNFVADIFGVSKQDREARIEKYADLFELTGDLAQPICGLFARHEAEAGHYLRSDPRARS